MGKQHIIFDFDEFIIDTSKLLHYMTNQKGREFVVENIKNLETKEYHPAIKEVIKTLAKEEEKKFSIVSNAPENYVRAILEKHGFPTDINIYGSAGKPDTECFEKVLEKERVEAKNVLSLGDAVRDILTSHEMKMPSAAGIWGYSEKDDLELSEPQKIMESPEELEQIIIDFEKGKIEYSERQNPKKYSFLQENEISEIAPQKIEIKNYSIGEYYSSKTRCFKTSPNSKKILDFKSIKNIEFNDLNNGKLMQFFYEGELVTKKTAYINVFLHFVYSAVNKIKEMNLKGKTLLVPSPNSLPDCAYKLDMPGLLAYNIKLQIKSDYIDCPKKRFLSRVYIKKELYKKREDIMQKQLETMGLLKNKFNKNYNNIIIMDDIRTDGNQINAIGKILRFFGYEGNLFSLVLGQTMYCPEDPEASYQYNPYF